MSVADQRYLIIGGAPKAGTTSLYKWLADHPEVCPASLKEVRFFLDEDYPLPAPRRFNGGNLQEYAAFFPCQPNDPRLRLEATPDYLYSKTALAIASLLPKARIIFILRDPVERMVSWYKYARQRGLINGGMSFRDYVMTQVGKAITPDTPTQLRGLEQCAYEKYLQPFREAFGSRCLVLDFNDLKETPQALMARVCEFAGIDQAFYSSYSFKAANVSTDVKAIWINKLHNAIRRRLVYVLFRFPAMMRLLRLPNQIIKKYIHPKQAEPLQIDIPLDLSRLIRERNIHE